MKKIIVASVVLLCVFFINNLVLATAPLTVREVTVIISPTTAHTGTSTIYTYKITNATSSTAKIGSFEIQLPSGFGTPSLSNIVTSSSTETWVLGSANGYTNGYNSTSRKIGIKASGASSELGSNDSVQIQITLVNPSSATTTQWTAEVWANLTFNGNVFTVYSQPTVILTAPDITAPIISSHSNLIAEATSNSGATLTYTNPTATDNIDSTVIVSCSPISSSTFSIGTTTVSCNASDLSFNIATTTNFKVIVKDTTVPTITLAGSNPQEVQASTTYSDSGATATDNIDGDLTTSIVVSNTVDTNIVGQYFVTYNVTDTHGNHANQVTRIVNVVDTQDPIITIIGANPQTIELGDSYIELGATAQDNFDGDISNNISIDASAVNINTAGTYAVTYNVADSNSNYATEVIRTVNVIYTPKPVVAKIHKRSSRNNMVFEPETLTNIDTKSISENILSVTPALTVVEPKTEVIGEVLGAERFFFANDLGFGSKKSPDVIELQDKLRIGGFFAEATSTGYFGKITKASVKKYQKEHHIIQTGFVGKLTREELNKN